MQKLLIITSFIVMTLGCCGPVGTYEYVPPPTTFQEADLVGTWQGKYNGVTDTLFIKNDGTYQQTAKDSQVGYFYQSDWNKWYIERRASGTFRVHFEKLSYYPNGLSSNYNGHGEYGPKGITSPLYDPVEEVFITTKNEVILRAEGTNLDNKVVLCHMESDPESITDCFRLMK